MKRVLSAACFWAILLCQETMAIRGRRLSIERQEKDIDEYDLFDPNATDTSLSGGKGKRGSYSTKASTMKEAGTKSPGFTKSPSTGKLKGFKVKKQHDKSTKSSLSDEYPKKGGNLYPQYPTRSPTQVGPVVPGSSSGSQPTVPAPSPVVAGPSVTLSPYSLRYDVSSLSLPPTSDVDAVVSLTSNYLNVYFGMNVALLDELETLLVDDSLDFPNQYKIDYSSTAMFSTRATDPPSKDVLDTVLANAFVGSNLDIYLSQLQALPATNMFSSTDTVVRELTQSDDQSPRISGDIDDGPESPSKPFDSKDAVPVPIIAAMGAAGFVLTLLGIVAYRRRRRNDTNDVVKTNEYDGHITLGGDTYDETSYSVSDAMTKIGHVETAPSDLGLSTHYEEGQDSNTLAESEGGEDIEDDEETGPVPLKQEGAGGCLMKACIEENEEDIEEELGCDADDGTEEDESKQHDLHDRPCESLTSTNLKELEAEYKAQVTDELSYNEKPENNASRSDNDGSEDDNVPVRVIDLIKKFS